MKKQELPRDIVRYVNKKIIRRIASFVFLEMVAIGIIVLSWDYFATKTNLGFCISLTSLLCVAPFYISGFPWKLIGKSWSETVIDVLIEEKKGVANTGAGKGHYYIKHVIYLKVKKNNGKEKYIAVREFGIRRYKGFPVPNEGDVSKHLDEYSIGDQVYHFYGLKHYYIAKKNSEMIDCVVCGAQNKAERTKCLNCGHSLIKNF